jgi:hypothetical protein
MRTDGRKKNRYDDAYSRLLQFSKSPKKGKLIEEKMWFNLLIIGRLLANFDVSV